jgi:DNA-binding transcriptional ArsR family regulator
MNISSRPRARSLQIALIDPVACLLWAARFKRISDSTRIAIMLAIGEGEQAVGFIRTDIGSTMTAVSRHLAVLRLAGLVVARRKGQQVFYSPSDAGHGMLGLIRTAAA